MFEPESYIFFCCTQLHSFIWFLFSIYGKDLLLHWHFPLYPHASLEVVGRNHTVVLYESSLISFCIFNSDISIYRAHLIAEVSYELIAYFALSYQILSLHIWWTFFIGLLSSITLCEVVKFTSWTMSRTYRCPCIFDFINDELWLKVMAFLFYSLEFLNQKRQQSHEVPPQKMVDLARRLEEGLVKSASSKVCHSSIFIYNMRNIALWYLTWVWTFNMTSILSYNHRLGNLLAC